MFIRCIEQLLEKDTRNHSNGHVCGVKLSGILLSALFMPKMFSIL